MIVSFVILSFLFKRKIRDLISRYCFWLSWWPATGFVAVVIVGKVLMKTVLYSGECFSVDKGKKKYK